MSSSNITSKSTGHAPALITRHPFKKYLLWLLLSLVAFQGSLQAQVDLTNCYKSCTSGDFSITSAILTNINGVPITSSACNNPDAVVPAYLTFTFTNGTNSDRNGIFISGTVNGNFQFKCFPGILPKKSSTTYTDKDHQVLWQCGTDLTLVGTFIAWGSGGDDVCNQSCSQATPSKCRTIGDLLIQTPLSANFTFAGKCENGKNYQTIDFTGSAAGGDHHYTFSWNFGDGTSSTLQSPSHSYTAANTYMVTFTVTDGSNTSKSVTKSVPVTVCCTSPTVNANPNAQTKCNGESASFTAGSTGGNPAPSVKWQVNKNDGAGFTDVPNSAPYSNVTTTTLTINPVSTTMSGYKYRAVFTSGVCTPATSNDATLTVNAIPGAPTVTVVNNCNNTSTLTASNFTGTLLWSTNATTTSITVSAPGTYTVRQTVNGCTSSPGSGMAAPKTTPGAPNVNVVNNCDGSSDLTASNYTGSLLWSTNATTPSIHVTTPGTYTVTQTVNGCTSANGSGSAAPKTTPGMPSITYNAPACDVATFTLTVSSVISNATYTIKDKNGNSISGVTPSGSFVAPNNNNFTFGNIPAGSGYKVTVTNNGCTSVENACPTATPSVQSAPENKIQQLEIIRATIGTASRVVVIPNPYRDQLRFTLESAESGYGSLELYNLLGQHVKTVYHGTFEKGRLQTIEYSVPGSQRANLIYVFTVGGQKVTGKLIGLK